MIRVMPVLVRARAHSDDRVIEVSFDATLWFEQASDEEILRLVKEGWGYGYAADEVARHFEETHTKELFDYLRLGVRMPLSDDPVGFECSVNEDDAMAWVKANRPALWRRIMAETAAGGDGDDPQGTGNSDLLPSQR